MHGKISRGIGPERDTQLELVISPSSQNKEKMFTRQFILVVAILENPAFIAFIE